MWKKARLNGHTPRGFICLQGREAKYGFSGFITTKKQNKKPNARIPGIPINSNSTLRQTKP